MWKVGNFLYSTNIIVCVCECFVWLYLFCFAIPFLFAVYKTLIYHDTKKSKKNSKSCIKHSVELLYVSWLLLFFLFIFLFYYIVIMYIPNQSVHRETFFWKSICWILVVSFTRTVIRKKEKLMEKFPHWLESDKKIKI